MTEAVVGVAFHEVSTARGLRWAPRLVVGLCLNMLYIYTRVHCADMCVDPENGYGDLIPRLPRICLDH